MYAYIYIYIRYIYIYLTNQCAIFVHPRAKALTDLVHSPKLRSPATGPTTWTKRRPARYIAADLPGGRPI